VPNSASAQMEEEILLNSEAPLGQDEVSSSEVTSTINGKVILHKREVVSAI